ncbi:FAD-dependent oxidoreductase [Clavibacter zhangzhiyongii]|uniref:FAD-dependent oxidoreductase n=2 Tax=Clavibacter zhangzhiyongii TaxID=2768071 RepID=A0A7L7Z630_9MICO|nr:FAD-dependent oxidoreductase [Clavibacter zhangzhiyongii]QOD45214.1 FAD-dependent oxidoreductase [Clavibacter zhangzhiyongii]
MRVVVIGGGYAGVMAANRVAASRGSTGVEVILVTAAEAFVERIRLHEHAAGAAASATVPFSSLLHPAVRVRVCAVERIDAAERVLALAGGDRLRYDALVYAAGSRATMPEGDGVHAIADLRAATRLRADLAILPPGAVVAVVGGGLTAIEAATEIAERHPSLTVRLRTGGEVAPSVAPRSRDRLRRHLARRGIGLEEHASVATTGDVRAALGADAVVWCTGFRGPALAADSGLPVTADGRLRVDAALAVVGGGGRVFGAGDAAVIDDDRHAHQRMGCASALPMGAHAADNVLRVLAGETPVPFSAGFVAQCLSLGRRDGLIQAVTADDRPRRLALTGRPAALVKEAVCRQTLRWLRGEAHRGGSYSWPRGPESAAPTTEEEGAWT